MRNLLAGAYLELFQKQALAFNIGPIYFETIIWPLSLSPGSFHLHSGIESVEYILPTMNFGPAAHAGKNP